MGRELFRMILDVASGASKPWSDRWGLYNALARFNLGRVTSRRHPPCRRRFVGLDVERQHHQRPAFAIAIGQQPIEERVHPLEEVRLDRGSVAAGRRVASDDDLPCQRGRGRSECAHR